MRGSAIGPVLKYVIAQIMDLNEMGGCPMTHASIERVDYNRRAITLARVFRWLAAAGFSSLGELRVSFGLLLLPAAAGGALGYDSGAGEGT